MSNMFLNIVSTFKGDGIKKATGELGAFSGKMGSFGSVLGKAAAGLAAFGVTAKAISFGQEAITQARDLERNMYGVQKVFGTMAPVMNEFVKNSSSFGLSQSEAAKATTFLGSVLKQSGFAMSDVTTETEKLVKLGVDLATLYGYDVQEALLGMTALFRGEYDPIEKFGVAMKQSEINAELAARGQNNLSTELRRTAEQTVRMELLYERAADALGSFDEQTNNLFVSQKVLGATFRDMQAAVGAALTPSITDLNQELTKLTEAVTPSLIKLFEFFAQFTTGLVSILTDTMDPTTRLGESILALGARFESLFKTIFGEDFDIAIIFELASHALSMFANLLHDVLLIIENIVDFIGITAKQMSLLFSGSVKGMKELFTTDWNQVTVDAFAENARAAEAAAGGMDTYTTSVNKARIEANLLAGQLLSVGDAMTVASPDRATSMARRAQLREENRAARSGSGASSAAASGTSATAAAAQAVEKGPTGIQAWLAKTDEEGRIAQKRIQLIGAGLSEAVAESITSGSDALLAGDEALRYLASNTAGYVAHFTDLFNKSVQGQQLAAAAAEKIAQDIANAAEEARQKEQAILDKRQAAYESFSDSVKSIFGNIKDSILSAFSLPELGNSVNSITRNIQKLLTRTRDFARNITSLSEQGLTNDLLQQVIAAGPMEGGRLAQALAGAGTGFIGQLNEAYGEFGSIASGIAGVGTNSAFGNQQVVNNYNIEVSGGVGSGPTIGKAIVDAIKSYERTSGAVWQGA